MKLESVFGVEKPVIGMLHLDYLRGQPEYRRFDCVLSKAKVELHNLQYGGIDGILIENWKEDTVGWRANQKNVECMQDICDELLPLINVPWGVNVLNNDWIAAFDMAKQKKARFVQLDTFVDNVRAKYDFSPSAKEHPFEIRPNPKEIIDYRKKIGAEDVSLFATVQPKHYEMLDIPYCIESSVRKSIENGADAIVVTGTKTGHRPTKDKLSRVMKISQGKVPIGIGSGFSRGNAEEYFPMVDFVIVGTDLKYENKTDNPVDKDRVAELMKIVKKMR